MNMREWAEREIVLLKEANKLDEGESFDYVGGCCDSALRAFESLLNDGHSGMSIQITKSILDQLIEGKALTPIEDVPEVWNDIGTFGPEEERSDIKRYQCKRMSSLFKIVYSDGTVLYSDCDRECGVDINNPSMTYSSGTISKIVNEMFPITMPYTPPANPYKVYTEDFLYDENNGDFDTVGVFYMITPNGERIEINKFHHYTRDNKEIELTKEQYEEMRANKVK